MKNFLISSLAVFATLSSAMPTSLPAETDASLALRSLEARAVVCTPASVDKLAFSVSLSAFQKARKAKNPSRCNWKSDGCTGGPDKPLMYNFLPACHRHDFAYRNTKDQKRFTKAMKKRIDVQFRADLYRYCGGFTGLKAVLGVKCRELAEVYYVAVRAFGRRDLEAVNDMALDRRGDETIAEFDDETDPDIEGQVIPDLVDFDDEEEDVEFEDDEGEEEEQ
jgi:phospholipase A2-like protein